MFWEMGYRRGRWSFLRLTTTLGEGVGGMLSGQCLVAGVLCCWRTASTPPLGRRLADLFTKVEAVIGLHLPDAVAVEESFVGRDPRAALAVGQVRGAILVACATAGVT